MRILVIMGAGGRDFHDFNTVFRDDPETRVVAFTATQIPGIAGRTYPPALAGGYYPDGIPILPEEELPAIVRDHRADEVVLAYSDLAHEDVMHKASIALAASADFRLVGPTATMLRATKPVVPSARCAPAPARARPAAGSAGCCWTRACGWRWSATRCPTATWSGCACSGSPP